MQAIRNEEQLINDLFDAQPQPVFWMRPVFQGNQVVDFEYAYCNEEMYRFTALPKEQILGMRLSASTLTTEENRKKFFAQLKEVFLSGRKMHETFYNPILKKHYTFYRSRVQDGVLTVIIDQTNAYQMLREVENQKNLLTNILRHSSSGISVTEVIRDGSGQVVDGRTIVANDAAIRFLGVPKDIYLSKTVLEMDPDILESPLWKAALDTLETGENFITQYYFAPGEKWLELSVSRMDSEHLINIFTDITQTKVAQLQVEAAAERLSAVFNAAQSGMFTFAPVYDDIGEIIDFRFVITNRQFAAYVHQTPEVLNGALGSTWFPGYLTNGVFDMYKRTFLTGETDRREVHYNVDGHDLYLDLMSTRVGDEVLITFTDYSELKKAQLQLENLVEELKRSNANLEDFAYAASHDLKEPIRKIHFFADRIKEQLGDKLGESGIRQFDRLQLATERMRLLVDDLLAYSHASHRPREFEAIDLNEKVKLVLGDIELLVEEKKGNIQVEKLPVVRGHRRQLQQLFHNLITNALKYSKPGIAPEIRISSKKVKGSEAGIPVAEQDRNREFHLIQVRDNGIGFEQKDEERIFQVFQRLHGNAEYKGTGVGLSIARKVVENHEGYIYARSQPGEGATFCVLLPVK